MREVSLNHEHRKIPFNDKLGYGVGNFSVGVSMQVVGAYLVFYCTAILGLPGSLVGAAVSLGVVWDAVTDPVMGYLSDITKSKTFGRRHLYILIGGIGIAITNYFLWNINADLSTNTKFIIVLIDLLAIKSFMTIFTTPYTALGAELSNDYNERTSIQGIKTIFFLMGLSFVSVVGMYAFFRPTSQFPIGQLNPRAYSNMGLSSSIIVIIFAILCFMSTKKYIPILNQSKNNVESNKNWFINLIQSFKWIFLNKTFRYVAFAYMFTNIASALLSNIGLHVFTYTFMLKSHQIAFIIGVQFLTSILSQPFWAFISRKIDKKPSMNLGFFLCIGASLLFLVSVFMKEYVKGNSVYFLPFAILGGFGTGGLFTLPLSMVADIIDMDELKTGKRSEGSYYGSLTLLYKLSQSIALFIIGLILSAVNFDSSLQVQNENTVMVLGLVLSLGTMISFILSFISLYGYNLNRSAVEHIQAQIVKKNSEKNLGL